MARLGNLIIVRIIVVLRTRTAMASLAPIQSLDRFWSQARIPVVFQRQRPAPLLVRLPYAADNKVWLRDDQRSKPAWDSDHGAWEVPQAWFERTIRLSFLRYRACYVVQLCRDKEVCGAACWNAVGADCECSCMGANHGSGRPAGRWYEVSETFAVMWGAERYSVRLLNAPDPASPIVSGERLRRRLKSNVMCPDSR